MKKLILGTLMFFAVQIGFAQASQDAQTFVSNLGLKAQLDAAKEQILPSIETGKEADFTKEFDEQVLSFISQFSSLVDQNYDINLVKEANKKFAETKVLSQVLPKDAVTFQEKLTSLQNEMGISLQGVMMKYAKAEELEGME